MKFPVFTQNLGMISGPGLNRSIVDTTGGGFLPTGFTVDPLGEVRHYGISMGVTVDRMVIAWDADNRMVGGIRTFR